MEEAQLKPELDEPHAPPRSASWPTAAQLIIADVIGIGIMSMADAFAELGWVLGATLCVLMLPLNLYCGYITWDVQVNHHPTTLSLADIGDKVLGRAGFYFVAALVYSFIFFVLGDYLLSLGLCLEQLFYTVEQPRSIWSLLGALCSGRLRRFARSTAHAGSSGSISRASLRPSRSSSRTYSPEARLPAASALPRPLTAS